MGKVLGGKVYTESSTATGTLKTSMSKFETSTPPADDLAPLGARASAGCVGGKYTVKCHYNAVQFIMILPSTLLWQQQNVNLTTDTPYLVLTGELWGIYCEDLRENLQPFNCIYTQYIHTWTMNSIWRANIEWSISVVMEFVNVLASKSWQTIRKYCL